MGMTHNIKFIDSDVQDGINATVRVGLRWARDISLGDEINIVNADDDGWWQTGVVVGLMTMPFNLIPQEIIEYQHSLYTRNRFTLAKVLRECYGKEFTDQVLCTVILFET